MSNYQVAEQFVSINGEGVCAGQLAMFVRFTKCNLHCNYCDTSWANDSCAKYTSMTEKEIYDSIVAAKVDNVTLTGGEPLIQENIFVLFELLSQNQSLRVEVETNGSIPIKPFLNIMNRPCFTLDYKLPGSGMDDKMCLDNYQYLTMRDTVKFVVSDYQDLTIARQIIEQYKLVGKCNLYLSPVFGRIEPADIVEYMIEHRMNQVNVQLQLHKFIWDPQKRGV